MAPIDTKYRLLEIMRRAKQIGHGAHMAPHGMPPAEARVALMIHFIAEEGTRPVQPSAIAERVHMAPSAVSQTFKSLEEKGLITRSRSEKDNRVVTIVLTKEGERLAKKIKSIHDRHLTDLIEAIGEQDAEELVRIMGKIVDYYERHAKDGGVDTMV